MLRPLMFVTAEPVIVSAVPTTRICIPPRPAEITLTCWLTTSTREEIAETVSDSDASSDRSWEAERDSAAETADTAVESVDTANDNDANWLVCAETVKDTASSRVLMAETLSEMRPTSDTKLASAALTALAMD